MIKITIPKNNLEERKYILDIVFNEFLGLEYQIIESDICKNWEIELENKKKLIFEDNFFNKYPKNLEYLNIENIPLKVEFIKNKFIVEEDIPVIYGNDKFERSETKIICGIDIFASSFFMLTRWEEYVNKDRDFHDRFSAKNSISLKNGFLNRPIVNEYVQMLKNIIVDLESDLIFKPHNSQMIVSCDVDQPFDCTVENFMNLIKTCMGDLIKRRSFNRIRRYFFNKFNNYKYDKNYSFDWYMDICDKEKLNVAFYFIPDNIEKGNGCYNLMDQKIQKLLNYIDSRGHEIGVHGSYQTYKDQEKAKKQKSMIIDILKELNISQQIKGNRQHYLRWDSAITPSILEYSGFEYDTTGAYADMPGFRYGVCYQFSMFDFLNRKKLKLKQRPLIVMECSVINEPYLGLGYTQESINLIVDLKNKCFKYNGNFSLLWHNSYCYSNEEKKMFEELIKC